MNNLALLPRALGALFYYSPEDEINQPIIENLESLLDVYAWTDSAQAKTLVDALILHKESANKYTFSVLFEGQGEMEAPPWGSVYLNHENLIMGDTTAAYYQFLARVGIDFEIHNQPLDQFGLMLWALAMLVEEGNQVAIIELLAVHLMPWSQRYLTLLASNQHSEFYAHLATLAELFLNQVKADIGLSIESVKLYK